MHPSGVCVARDHVRAGQRLVRVGEVEVADPVLLADLEAAARMVERRLRPPEHRVDARALPLAAREVDRFADERPVVARGVRGVQHLVVLAARPRRACEQRPDVVEEVDCDLPLGRAVERSSGGAHASPSASSTKA